MSSYKEFVHSYLDNEGNEEFRAYQTFSIDRTNVQDSKCPSPMKGEKLATHGFVQDVLRKVMGETLTIIDASVVDVRQNKAMKDLLRKCISDQMEFIADMMYDQNVLSKLATEAYDKNGMMEPVTIEEALGVNEG